MKDKHNRSSRLRWGGLILLAALWVALLWVAYRPTPYLQQQNEAFAFSRVLQVVVIQRWGARESPDWLTRALFLRDETLLREVLRVFDSAEKSGTLVASTRPSWGLVLHLLGDAAKAQSALSYDPVDESGRKQKDLVESILENRPIGADLQSWVQARYEGGTSELPEWHYLAVVAEDEQVRSWLQERGRIMIRRGLVADLLMWTLLLIALGFGIRFLVHRKTMPASPVHRRFVRAWSSRKVVREFLFASILGISGAILVAPIPASAGYYAESVVLSGFFVLVCPAIWLLFRLTPGWTAALRIGGLTKHPWSKSSLANLAGVGLLLIALFAYLSFRMFPAGYRMSDLIRADALDSHFQVIWIFCLACVIAPLCEEWIYRGVLFGALAEKWGPGFAAVGSSLIFSTLHFYSWRGGIDIFFVGLAFCWIYRRSGSLWPGIMVHAAYNLILTTQTAAWFSLH